MFCGMSGFDFAGHRFDAVAQGALFWPARRALIVADLHFEKASWFARSGQMLPPYDSVATLSDLMALVTARSAREVWCLGDSFHDSAGITRLPLRAQAMLAGMTEKVAWTWITGNHDAGLTAMFGGHVRPDALIDGVILRHEADPAEPRPELSGHFHPRLRIPVRGRTVARRCFVVSDSKVILPAFGALTGGLDAGHPAILRAVGATARALIAVNDRMLSFPLAA